MGCESPVECQRCRPLTQEMCRGAERHPASCRLNVDSLEELDSFINPPRASVALQILRAIIMPLAVEEALRKVEDSWTTFVKLLSKT